VTQAVPQRILGRVEGGDGPTVVIVTAVHGDEPAGVEAARSVLAAVERHRARLRGRVLAVVANRAALAVGRRFVAEDFNRGWHDATLARLADPSRVHAAEDRDRRELWAIVSELGPATFVDLHTMSGPGAPFVVVPAGTDPTLAAHIDAPAIVGLDDRTDGALLRLLTARGHRGVGVEGGRHDDPAAVAHLGAAAWQVIAGAGGLDLDEVPEAAGAVARLRASTAGLPRVVEITGEHRIARGDGFAMVDGWSSFARVRAGDVLARADAGDVRAASDGLLLLPNYLPGRGDHGFFLGREVITAGPDR
jgi:succinylglutamate desuccinylase